MTLTFTRRKLAAVTLCVCGAFSACSREPTRPERHPMIVIGVDGADWAVIEEMWRRDRLPTMRALAEDGSRAVLKTSWASSPVIWSTVATGAVPSVHGITGFVDETDGGDVPVSSSLRRVPALWNMLTSISLRTVVIGWWATWPAEEIDGVIVSDRVLESIDQRFSPASFAETVERGLRRSAELETPFSGIGVGEERDRAMAWFAARLAKEEDFDLLLAYFRSTDLASHYYWRYFANEGAPPGGEAAEAESKRERIFRAYEAVDRSIADILSAAGEPANVFVISDHGFRTARREIVRVVFDLDRALEGLGYLARDDDGGVDVARSRLYTYASGPLTTNKMVRFGEADAGAPSGKKAELRAALARDLARLTWPGGAAAVRIAEPAARHARRGADLMVQIETEAAATPLLLDGAPLEGVVKSVHHISGSHGASTDGILIAAGPDIAEDAVLDGIHVRDMAPTFLYGLDAPVARDFAGRPWQEIYSPAYRARHPLREIDTWGTREHGSATRSTGDEKLLEELRALGYLD
jgi:predicted AlkP superfamily phosphohydrolase/phosphomutase